MPAASFSASAACMLPMMPTSGANTPIVAQATSSKRGVWRERRRHSTAIRRRAVVDRNLAVEADRGAGDQRPGVANAGGVDGLARREVVAAVDDHVGVGDQLGQAIGVDPLVAAPSTSMRGLMSPTESAADIAFGVPIRAQVVGDLALQVGEVDAVAVDDRDPADAGGAEVQRHRRAEPAGADDQRMRREQALLALDADVVEQQVARVAQQVVVVHRRS